MSDLCADDILCGTWKLKRVRDNVPQRDEI